jgi:hypothetical protein
MTYRDDLEAAQQRAQAFEAELGRTKAERDRATSERDQLADELAKERAKVPETDMVVAESSPLRERERDELMMALSRG